MCAIALFALAGWLFLFLLAENAKISPVPPSFDKDSVFVGPFIRRKDGTSYVWDDYLMLCAGRSCLWAGFIDAGKGLWDCRDL